MGRPFFRKYTSTSAYRCAVSSVTFKTRTDGLLRNCANCAVFSAQRFPARNPLYNSPRTTAETFVRLRKLDGLPTMVAAFTTDIPSLPDWGEPLLLGPGSIHVAHTEGEFVEKTQLTEAVEIYCSMAKKLSSGPVGGN